MSSSAAHLLGDRTHRPVGRGATAEGRLNQASVVFCWPGSRTLITPGIAHISLSVDNNTGRLSIVTPDVEPGCQGPVGTMAQGVGTPRAAAVRTLQVPKGGMLASGLKSMTVAASKLSMVALVWLFT